MSPDLLARLMDQPPPRVTICAWCPGFNPRDPKNKGASHGCCPTCVAKLNAELDQKDAAS